MGPTPVKALRRAFACERIVVVVDEFRSTATHNVCGNALRRRWSLGPTTPRGGRTRRSTATTANLKSEVRLASSPCRSVISCCEENETFFSSFCGSCHCFSQVGLWFVRFCV